MMLGLRGWLAVKGGRRMDVGRAALCWAWVSDRELE